MDGVHLILAALSDSDARGQTDITLSQRDVGLNGTVNKHATLGVADLAVVWGLIDEVVLGVILEILVVFAIVIVVIVLGVKLGDEVVIECPRPERPTKATDRHCFQAWRCVLRHRIG